MTDRTHEKQPQVPSPGNRIRIAAALLAVAALVGLAVVAGRRGSSPTTAFSTNPDRWELPRLGGQGTVRLADFRGKPVVANFFASWCVACEEELPGLAKVSRELEGQVVFVGVNSLDAGQGLSMARRFGIDQWPLVRDVGGEQGSGLHDALGARGMPATVFYDASGRRIDFAGGALSEAQFRERMRRLYGVRV
ncbi:MAG: TlpA family protein disulfide reductase [Actinomycetota bacterium]